MERSKTTNNKNKTMLYFASLTCFVLLFSLLASFINQFFNNVDFWKYVGFSLSAPLWFIIVFLMLEGPQSESLKPKKAFGFSGLYIIGINATSFFNSMEENFQKIREFRCVEIASNNDNWVRLNAFRALWRDNRKEAIYLFRQNQFKKRLLLV